MKKIIMGIGIPGSGKTTVLKGFAERYSYDYVCPDDIRAEITGDPKDQSKNKEVWDEAYRRAVDSLAQNHTLIFDATFANIKDRLKFINFAKENGAEKIQGLYVNTPLEVAKERNANRERVVPEFVLDRMNKQLNSDEPKIEEGFDSIFTLNEYHKLVEVEKLEGNKLLNKNFKVI